MGRVQRLVRGQKFLQRLEGTNNEIKVTERRGYGFRDDDFIFKVNGAFAGELD